VDSFERAWADYCGRRHGVAVCNGSAALQAAVAALELGPGDEVVVPTFTIVSCATAVLAVGATPVLVDCDPETYGIDPAQVAAAVTPRTTAILPVHFTGQAADLGPLLQSADRFGLALVEDCAQAHGTRWEGRPCGSLGAVGCFSFYPSKNLGAYGDGGMATTSDEALAERLRRLRNYGERRKYEHVVKGVNSRLDAVQAAVLGVKLPRLTAWNEARARHADAYARALDGVGDLTLQRRAPSSTHVYHLFLVETQHRDELRSHLRGAGIETGIHYPTPIHLQEAYSELGLGRGAFPVSERVADRTLSLPMYPELTAAQIAIVTESIRDFFARR
jgi:dTDP-4-amino-4,6-dideoxygalactose transaminase